MNGKFVALYRVSTDRQGKTGYGLEAQQQAVMNFLNGGSWELVAEHIEVVSGRKTDKDRPGLMKAIATCRKEKATLIVAKLDRLSRNVKNFLEIIDTGINVRFIDFPDVDPSTAEGRLMLTQICAFAEFEAKKISARTKAALAVAKQRGVVLGATGPQNLKGNIEERQEKADGFAEKLRGVIAGMKGKTQREMVEELNSLGVKTARGGEWSLIQLQRVLKRLDKAA